MSRLDEWRFTKMGPWEGAVKSLEHGQKGNHTVSHAEIKSPV